MIRLRAILFVIFVCFCGSSEAADRITATIAVTNAPLGNTNSLTVNGNVRTFTNSVTGSPGTLVQQTNSVPWSATNLINQLADYRISQFHVLGQSASNNVRITGTVGEALTVSLAGLWGTVTYSTQNVTIANVVRVPMSVEFDTNRAWIASMLVTGLSDYATNGMATNAAAMANYVSKGASALQEVIAPALFSGGLRGSNTRLTNGYTSGLTNINPVNTNLINYGNAIRSEGSGGNSLQVGSNAVALGLRSMALGNGSTATNTDAIAIGTGAAATNTSAVAIGTSTQADGVQAVALGGGGTYARGAGAVALGGNAVALVSAIALGPDAAASGTNAIAIGNDAQVALTAPRGIAIGFEARGDHADSVAIGKSATTTTTNQIRLGTSSDTISAPGIYDGPVSTNATLRGTNIINGRLDAPIRANTTLANGYNSGSVLGTNLVIEFSGPSGAYTNAGFAAPGGPQLVWASFDNPGLSFTLLNESGLEATAANRITTDTGALLNSTNRTVHACLRYDTTTSRWRVLNFR